LTLAPTEDYPSLGLPPRSVRTHGGTRAQAIQVSLVPGATNAFERTPAP